MKPSTPVLGSTRQHFLSIEKDVMITPRDTPDLPGRLVVDEAGAPVGVLVNSYSDPDTGLALWASVRRHSGEVPDLFVPLAGATLENDASTVKVAAPIGVIAGSPLIHPPFTFTDDTARTLSAYYDQASAAMAPTNAGEAATDSVDAAAWAVRSEEKLRIHTERVPVERVRLRKVIITEQKTITVTLRREEFQLVREPYDPDTASADASASETAFDMVLHEERPVVSTVIVPVERVHVDVVSSTVTVPVAADIAKERVEISTTETPAPSITDKYNERAPHE